MNLLRRLRLSAFLAGLLLVFAGCSSPPPLRAPRNPDGSAMTMFVLVKTGNHDDTPADTAAAREDITSYIASDLSGRLGNYGWDAKVVKSADEAPLEGSGVYLTSVDMTEFLPGNKDAVLAGRIAGGWGGGAARDAGSARVKIEYQVLQPGGSAATNGAAWHTDERGPRRCATVVDGRAATAITRNLANRHGQ